MSAPQAKAKPEICPLRRKLMLEWNDAVQEMARLVSPMSKASAFGEEAFEDSQRRVELARNAAKQARAELDLHRAEHGC